MRPIPPNPPEKKEKKKYSLSLLPPSNPRTSLAAHSNVSDSACFQLGADTLSIIIRGFCRVLGSGQLARMCKSFHEESLELPSEASAVDGDPQEGQNTFFVTAGREGRKDA